MHPYKDSILETFLSPLPIHKCNDPLSMPNTRDGGDLTVVVQTELSHLAQGVSPDSTKHASVGRQQPAVFLPLAHQSAKVHHEGGFAVIYSLEACEERPRAILAKLPGHHQQPSWDVETAPKPGIS
ncbi:hypothetical protein ABL78_4771 [Leptomonas seymouri]|uniref:Uncharacterized protein n=1 Tax=Leptomonas seymouri TaxID=5684 RepID=A0A0N1IJZ2_LEPSE|nr:hypothetical protein ABL78_4771 [Leptomonas seymouri]|eukprot:KPI86182.1 hypothetical protein ABL78_4771 [Leptomonas seymouri]